jgi:hypothetical protein
MGEFWPLAKGSYFRKLNSPQNFWKLSILILRTEGDGLSTGEAFLSAGSRISTAPSNRSVAATALRCADNQQQEGDGCRLRAPDLVVTITHIDKHGTNAGHLSL